MTSFSDAELLIIAKMAKDAHESLVCQKKIVEDAKKARATKFRDDLVKALDQLRQRPFYKVAVPLGNLTSDTWKPLVEQFSRAAPEIKIRRGCGDEEEHDSLYLHFS